MAGTSAGARKAAEKRKKADPDIFRKMGQAGGKAGSSKSSRSQEKDK